MDIRVFVLGAGGAHAVAPALIRRNLREEAYRPQDRFRVELSDPPLRRDLSRDELEGFFALFDLELRPFNPAAVRVFMGGAAEAPAPAPAQLEVAAPGVQGFQTAPAAAPAPPPPAPGVQGFQTAPSPSSTGAPPPPAPPPQASPAPANPAAAWIGSRPMLVALAALLLIGAFLVWPRDRGERAAPQTGAAQQDEIASRSARAEPEAVDPRYARLDAIAYAEPDVASAHVRALRRGERVDAVTAGGEAGAPEGWVRLQSGGYVTAESLAAIAPPTLQSALNQDVQLPVQTALFANPRLTGRPQRTLAAGQPLRLIGLVSDEVAEVRIGQELGYIAYAAVFAPPPAAAPAPSPRQPQQQVPAPRAPSARETGPPGQRQPPVVQAPQPPLRDTPQAQPRAGQPGVPAAPRDTPQAQPRVVSPNGPVVLGMEHLTRQPSNNTMLRYYPPRALRNGVGASVSFSCRVANSGRLTGCVVYRETGSGAGFSEATLRLAQETFQVGPRTEDGRSTAGAQFSATITWRVQ